MAFILAGAARAQDPLTVEWNSNPETDIAGYVFYLGTTSGVYSSIEDIGNETSRVLSGLVPGSVYYCAIQAYNSAGLTSILSEEFSFTPQTPAELFEGWASAGGLGGAEAAPGATPFSDGVRNLAKFAFNMNPAGPDVRTLNPGTGVAGLPRFALDRSGPEPLFTVEFLRRKGSGLTYTPKSTTDFVTYQPMAGATTVTDIDLAWERVVIGQPVSTATTPRLFGVVEVNMP